MRSKMSNQRACKEYKLFILLKAKNFAEFSSRMILSLIPFQRKTVTGLYELYQAGMVGRIRCPKDGRIFNYFITFKGRKFLADNGDKTQLKYLNLQLS